MGKDSQISVSLVDLMSQALWQMLITKVVVELNVPVRSLSHQALCDARMFEMLTMFEYDKAASQTSIDFWPRYFPATHQERRSSIDPVAEDDFAGRCY